MVTLDPGSAESRDREGEFGARSTYRSALTVVLLGPAGAGKSRLLDAIALGLGVGRRSAVLPTPSDTPPGLNGRLRSRLAAAAQGTLKDDEVAARRLRLEWGGSLIDLWDPAPELATERFAVDLAFRASALVLCIPSSWTGEFGWHADLSLHIGFLAGVRVLLVAISQSDRSAYDQRAFEGVLDLVMTRLREQGLNFVGTSGIPIAVQPDDGSTANVVARSDLTPWFSGQPLLPLLSATARESWEAGPWRGILTYLPSTGSGTQLRCTVKATGIIPKRISMMDPAGRVQSLDHISVVSASKGALTLAIQRQKDPIKYVPSVLFDEVDPPTVTARCEVLIASAAELKRPDTLSFVGALSRTRCRKIDFVRIAEYGPFRLLQGSIETAAPIIVDSLGTRSPLSQFRLVSVGTPHGVPIAYGGVTAVTTAPLLLASFKRFWAASRDGVPPSERGKSLECLVRRVFEAHGFTVLSHGRRTPGEETDLIAQGFDMRGVWSLLGPRFAIECKNTARPVGVEVLYGIGGRMVVNAQPIVILVSRAGVTGRGARAARLIQRELAQRGYRILCLNEDDLRELEVDVRRLEGIVEKRYNEIQVPV